MPGRRDNSKLQRTKILTKKGFMRCFFQKEGGGLRVNVLFIHENR